VDGVRKNVGVTGVSLPSFEPGAFKSALELSCMVTVLLSAMQLGKTDGHHCKHQLPIQETEGRAKPTRNRTNRPFLKTAGRVTIHDVPHPVHRHRTKAHFVWTKSSL